MNSRRLQWFYLFLFILFPILVEAQQLTENVCKAHQCIGIVDAGSSGSRLHVYTYDKDKEGHPINVIEIFKKSVKPGLSTLQPDSKIITAYLDDLFDDMAQFELPVYFYATAGMRLLSKTAEERILKRVNNWFLNHKKFKLKGIQTISGKEEGAFGWLAVNYQLGALYDDNKPLVGVIDMGGASTQISFPLASNQKTHTEDEVNFQIGSRHITLFTHSFLGLGQTLVLQQYLDEKTCFPQGYPLSNRSMGEGDSNACRQHILKLVNEVHGVEALIKDTISHATPVHWYAMGGVSSLMEQDIFKENNLSSEQLFAKAQVNVCQENWTSLQNRYPTDEYLYSYCIMPAFYYALFIDGYGLSPGEPLRQLPKTSSVDWSLGVLLDETFHVT